MRLRLLSDAQIATMVNGMKTSIDKIALGITVDEVPLVAISSIFGKLTRNSNGGFGFSTLGSPTNFSIVFYSATMKRTIASWRFYVRRIVTWMVRLVRGGSSFCAASLPHL